MAVILILSCVIFLSYVNGANDNFKGVATLFGSGAASYKKALWWATGTTLLGSLTAIFISTRLIVSFSGKGLVSEAIVGSPHFLISVGMGAALTVFIATMTGIPISTTHSLIGALTGAGLASAGRGVNFYALGSNFFIPLLVSPAVSLFLTLVVYPFFKFARVKLGIERRMCLCVNGNVKDVCIRQDGTAVLKSTGVVVTVGQLKNCEQYYQGKIFGFDFQWILDKFHYISAGMVSFARGLNDTPKIVALLLLMSVFSIKAVVFIVACAMAIGGLLSARKVALTMGSRITNMNHGQGFSANLITAFLVIFASKWGMPVSTTHVSCGSIFGIGIVNKKADMAVIRQIILAWIFTLPLAAVLSGVCFLLIQRVI
ncbi:MAG: inorganic phosphate transporter [Candidatus Omnitrophica bacterium]|nr:inorganic phosphate transporter [Candidatus Omnitrophota bacterium]